jgi:hypothetical protein
MNSQGTGPAKTRGPTRTASRSSRRRTISVNPALTIMANAIRVGEHQLQRLG